MEGRVRGLWGWGRCVVLSFCASTRLQPANRTASLTASLSRHSKFQVQRRTSLSEPLLLAAVASADFCWRYESRMPRATTCCRRCCSCGCAIIRRRCCCCARCAADAAAAALDDPTQPRPLLLQTLAPWPVLVAEMPRNPIIVARGLGKDGRGQGNCWGACSQSGCTKQSGLGAGDGRLLMRCADGSDALCSHL